jgi:glucan biosynthesis protein C
VTLVATSTARPLSAAGRLYYLDNLRVSLTALVIAHHVGQAYGPTGGW